MESWAITTGNDAKERQENNDLLTVDNSIKQNLCHKEEISINQIQNLTSNNKCNQSYVYEKSKNEDDHISLYKENNSLQIQGKHYPEVKNINSAEVKPQLDVTRPMDAYGLAKHVATAWPYLSNTLSTLQHMGHGAGKILNIK